MVPTRVVELEDVLENGIEEYKMVDDESPQDSDDSGGLDNL